MPPDTIATVLDQATRRTFASDDGGKTWYRVSRDDYETLAFTARCFPYILTTGFKLLEVFAPHSHAGLPPTREG